MNVISSEQAPQPAGPEDYEIQPQQEQNDTQIEMASIDNSHSQQPLLAVTDHSSNSLAGAAPTDHNSRRRNEIKELENKSVDIDKRLQELQARTFQLANIYFVFQGVILTVVLTSKTLKCQDCWIPFCLSLIAAGVNLIALQQLGDKYIKTLAVQDSIQFKIYELDSRGANPLQTTQGFQKRKRNCIFVLSLLLLISFSVIMLSSCWVKFC